MSVNHKENILSITLLGVTHKIRYSPDGTDAKAVLDLIGEELGAIESRTTLSIAQESERLLLTAALNLSKKFLELKQKHEKTEKEIEVKFDRLASLLKEQNPAHSPLGKPGTPSVIQPVVSGSSAAPSVPEAPKPSLPVPATGQVHDKNPSAGKQSEKNPLPVEAQEKKAPVPDRGLKPATAHDRERISPVSTAAAEKPEAGNPASGKKSMPFHQRSWQRPPSSFLTPPATYSRNLDQNLLQLKAEILVEKLKDFGIQGKIVRILPGPVITTFEYRPAPGIKISKITNLSNDLALALSAISIRIVAPIPGRDVVGIEIPNPDREMVRLREIIESEVFRNNTSSLALCLGKDIEGKPVVEQLNRMPHLLIAGATGTGKSVGLNAMITSLIYKASPNEVKLLMIDPKRIELSFYSEIPHLITPVVTDMKLATHALFWAVREMERRYELLDQYQARNIKSFNEKMKSSGKEPLLPFIVIVIDELADLMMVASRDVETALARLAQMARAAGIHLILATQRPSVDVLTGLIKANFPTRISFQVSSKIDSRTIIDGMGAETLLGNGDMLYLSSGSSRLQRIHGAFISEEELNRVTSFLKMQGSPEYIPDITDAPDRDNTGNGNTTEYDERYDEAVELILRSRQTSASWLQRQLRIGYNRAARIIETMEREGILGPADGPRPREILLSSYENRGDRDV